MNYKEELVKEYISHIDYEYKECSEEDYCAGFDACSDLVILDLIALESILSLSNDKIGLESVRLMISKIKK